MRFTHSKMYTREWKDVEPNLTHIQVIEAVYFNVLKPWDFDNCGEADVFFAFDDGKYYRLRMSWWWENDSEGNYGPNGHEHYVEEVNIESVPEWMRKQRNWLKV